MVKSGDTITLAHGQSVIISGLPAGATFQVTEECVAGQGYASVATDSSGTIIAGGNRTAVFTNTKVEIPTGALTISKNVVGEKGSLTKKFNFTLTLSETTGIYPYSGSAVGSIKSGDKISLADGESITISGLPEGTKYSIIEEDYRKDGYATNSTAAAGTISATSMQAASFTNTWSTELADGMTPGDPTEIGTGTAPSDPTTNIGDGDLPFGGTEPGKDGIPKTGNDQTEHMAKLALLFFSLALAVLTTANFVIRRKKLDGKK